MPVSSGLQCLDALPYLSWVFNANVGVTDTVVITAPFVAEGNNNVL